MAWSMRKLEVSNMQVTLNQPFAHVLWTRHESGAPVSRWYGNPRAQLRLPRQRRCFGTAQPTPGIYFLTCATLKRVFFISQHIMADLLIYPAFISQFTDHKIATEVLTGLMPTLDNMPIIPLLDNLHSSLF